MKFDSSLIAASIATLAVLTASPGSLSAFSFDESLSTKADKTDSSSEERPVFKNQYFSAPEMLMVGEVPLNSLAKKKYPSPAMYDVDGDGDVELVVGDIFGAINVYENSNVEGDESEDPVWKKHTRLKNADGKPVKVSNW